MEERKITVPLSNGTKARISRGLPSWNRRKITISLETSLHIPWLYFDSPLD
jgi:hypothetical protein